ncbi:BTLCP-like protein [Shewanella sp. phage 1/4]|uniref:BTLCP-like protein n=1 Tax=Shewanella phage 1/4 TaxID=1458859 RepID=UPI0004F60E2B|nr:BTLCP-like protein [Shewanella sp. phage 1/4]AHK11283.1 BTLCP-like protein [Shewanella sp. phage 1/4]
MKLLLTLILLIITGCSTIPSEYYQLQSYAQYNHVYISDMEQYGVEDKYVISLTGDCEDYALFIQSKVGGKLAMVRTKDNSLHMVLIKDDYVFDNMSPRVYLRKDMEHHIIAEFSN